MGFVDLLAAVANTATALAVGVAARQLQLTMRQERVRFEDALAKEYREIAQQLPIEALLGGEVLDELLEQHLHGFYRYLDLTNEQILLRHSGRISDAAWADWGEGIALNMGLPAFRSAMARLDRSPTLRFAALRKLRMAEYRSDPRGWPRDWASTVPQIAVPAAR